MPKRYLVPRCAAKPYRICPYIGARLFAVEARLALLVDAVRKLVVRQKLLPAANRRRFERVESLGRPALGQHEHKLPCVCVGVGAHKRRVALLVNHNIVNDEANVLEHHRLAKTRH